MWLSWTFISGTRIATFRILKIAQNSDRYHTRHIACHVPRTFSLPCCPTYPDVLKDTSAYTLFFELLLIQDMLRGVPFVAWHPITQVPKYARYCAPCAPNSVQYIHTPCSLGCNLVPKGTTQVPKICCGVLDQIPLN